MEISALMLDELEDEVESLELELTGGGPGGVPGGRAPALCDVEPLALTAEETSPSWERKLSSAAGKPAMPEASMDGVEALAEDDEFALVLESLEALVWLAAARINCKIKLC